ncbi:hypothetical protein FQN57_001024 [Myotisia sp. PD_48]|nr:hypothetical protein FQN57_001024 [Myotisia sp. PD_48]
MADAEFSDPHRINLIEKVWEKLQQQNMVRVHPSSYAFLWLADVENLEKMVESDDLMKLIGSGCVFGLQNVIRMWLQKVRPGTGIRTIASDLSEYGETGTGSWTTTVIGVWSNGRSAYLTETRDQRACVLEKQTIYDVVPVISFSLEGSPDELLWSTLRIFLCREKVARKAAFGLKFISMAADGTSIKLKFHWLKSSSLQTSIKLTQQPSIEHPDGFGLFSYEKGLDGQRRGHLRSGDVVRLTTDNVKERPLPNPSLIEMQWHLNRVAALSGTAESVEWHEDERAWRT